jgi:uncharacterized protein (TIGR01777 family)
LHWDPEVGDLDRHDLEGFDAVVHMAGEPLVGVWTKAKKRSIMDSRRQGTRLLAEALAAAEQKPAVLVSSGAIGYYGDRGDELLDEESSSGKGFLADVCEHWEDAAQPARDAGIRVVNLRIGLVLGRDGGMLDRILPVFRFGLGGRIGNGKQWWSWISAEDVVGVVEFAMAQKSLEGPVNVVAPEPVTNAQFTKALGGHMRRPTIFAVPRFAVRTVAREVADEMLLASQRVSSDKIQSAGYEFRHKVLDDALDEVLVA